MEGQHKSNQSSAFKNIQCNELHNYICILQRLRAYVQFLSFTTTTNKLHLLSANNRFVRTCVL